MLKHTLTLRIFEPDLAICRLPPKSPFPAWIGDGEFVSVTRTPEELSIVCHEILEAFCIIENRKEI